jgi:protein-disulfide isomerase
MSDYPGIANLLELSEDRDHIRGSPNAAVTLLEYGDYQCPFCGQAHPIVREIQEAFGDDLRFAFRHFPLTQIHPYAERAAEAAEAAGAQGRFWEMHDTLYDNQDALDDESLLGYAQTLDLDLIAFTRDLASGTFAPRVREDFMSGVRAGVNGTPTFFINGQRHNGPWDVDSLAAAIEGELEHVPARDGGRGAGGARRRRGK